MARQQTQDALPLQLTRAEARPFFSMAREKQAILDEANVTERP